MLLLDITTEFDLACTRELAQQPEILSFVKRHERRNVVLGNLCQQVVLFERTFRGQKTREKRSQIIDAAALMFISAVKRQREESNWSHARKAQERAKGSLRQEVSRLIKEAPTHGKATKGS